MMDVFQLDDSQSAALRLGKLKVDLPLIIRRRFDFLHALNLLELALGLGGLGVLGPETVHKFHQPPDFALLMFVCRQELLFVRFALRQVIIITAAVTDKPALADFDDAADQFIEKLAVVRDDQDRAGIMFQVFLKPKQRLQIQVIGRFIEQQQVGLLCQQPRQVRAHHPAAAHFAGGPVEIFFPEAKPGENLLGFGFETIAAQLIETIVHIIVNLLGVQR